MERGDKKGSEDDTENEYKEGSTIEGEGSGDAIDKGEADDEGDDSREDSKVVAGEIPDFGDDGEDKNRDSYSDAGGDGVFFDVFDELVFDAGGVFLQCEEKAREADKGGV